MKLELFVSRRIISSRTYKGSVSAPIVKIAIVAVILSIAMILISIATGIGLKNEIRNKVSTFSGDILISNYDNNYSEESIEPIEISENTQKTLLDIKGVQTLSPIATKSGVIRRPDTFEGILFRGFSQNYPIERFKPYLVEGRLPDLTGENISNEILISEHLANRLSISLDTIIQTYFLRKEEAKRPWILGFKVVGIYNSGMEQFDHHFIYGDLKQIQRMNKWNRSQMGSMAVFVDDFSEIPAVTNEVYTHTPSQFNTLSIIEKYYNIFEWIQLFDTNILIILTLMILVASINMIVALLVLILERTKMVGILKTLGAKNGEIQRIFLLQASYILLFGLGIGNVLGLGLLYIQKEFKVLKLDPSQYYVNTVPVDFNWLNIALVNILFIVLCYFFMLLPSFIITKMNPVDAIKRD